MKTSSLICQRLASLRKPAVRYSSIAPDKAEPPSVAIKSFDEIPGPRGPFGLGNLYNYLPIVGRYSWQELHSAGRDKYERYGPIVRETMVPGTDIVWLYEPHDIATLLNERNYPQRRSHLALEKYRNDRPHVYRTAGLLPTNGVEWWRLRSQLQKEVSAPKNVRNFIADVDAVTQEFLEQLTVGQPFDFLPMLGRLNLELTSLLTFGERLNAFSPPELQPDSRASRLLRAAEATNSSILPTDQGLRLWRYLETPAYRRLRKAQEYMESVAIDLVAQRQKHLKESDHRKDTTVAHSSLIEQYLRNPQLQLADVVGMAADLILAGIDTTSYTTGFAIYHIAQHAEVQRKLHEEALRLLPEKRSPLDADALSTQVPYTRAVLKEVFRLNPISVGVGRILNSELILSGYRVPPGTVVVTQNMIACRLERHFAEPLRFAPERWLERRNAVNPYLVLPFGHGMRACIARRMAEQNMLVFLLRTMRNYEIVWDGRAHRTEMGVRTLLINKPRDPVTVVLKERK